MPRHTLADKKLDKAVGARIKLARQRKGWTQPKLSVVLGVQAETLSRYESGVVPVGLAMLFRIAKILDVNVNVLLGVPPKIGLSPSAIEVLQRWELLDADGQRLMLDLIRRLHPDRR